jgi:hypothetical protein
MFLKRLTGPGEVSTSLKEVQELLRIDIEVDE